MDARLPETVLRAILGAAAESARVAARADHTAGVILSPSEWSGSPLAASKGAALPLELVRLAVRTSQRGPIAVPGARPHPGLARAAKRANLGAVAAASFRAATGSGCVLAARTRPMAFSAAEIARLEGVAACTEHATRAAAAAFVAERRDLARVLHDDFGQTLTALVFALDGLAAREDDAGARARAEAAATVARKAVQGLRRAISTTRDAGASKVLPTLAALVDDLSRSGVAVTLNLDPAGCALQPAVVECASRIAREALLNVQRHARAGRVGVTLSRDAEGSAVELAVSDDGRGFLRDHIADAAWGGFGLAMMRERAEEVGGTLAIESTIGHGTRTVARLPCTLTDPGLG